MILLDAFEVSIMQSVRNSLVAAGRSRWWRATLWVHGIEIGIGIWISRSELWPKFALLSISTDCN